MRQFLTLFIFFLFSFSLCTIEVLGSLPNSRVASILEVVSSSEILMEAQGHFSSQEKGKRKKRKEVKKIGIDLSVLDAKRAAIYYLLYDGTDPLYANPNNVQVVNYIYHPTECLI